MKNRTQTAARVRQALLLLSAAGILVGTSLAEAPPSKTRKDVKIEIAPGGSLNVITGGGSVILHSGGGRQVLVSYVTHSDKVEVDQSGASNQRVELRSHVLSDQKPTAEEAAVDYEITVPSDVSVNVSTTSAPVNADGLSGDIGLSSETGQITVRNSQKAHVRVRSMTGAVTLNNVALSRVEIQSAGGTVMLTKVTGQRVSVGTTSGNIEYHGDFSGGGDYLLTTHSGAIDVTLPQTASVDLTARSNKGSVENDFPLEEKSHNSFTPQSGRSFAGTSNSGSSSVELQSFSGKIRVKKQ
jgi:DUF4097 and DUF4098 domain-containing protein YvlB